MNAKTNVKALALLALGTAAVLLFTTDKGKKIRKTAKSKAGDWGDDFSDWREEAADKLASLKKRFMKEVETLSDEVSSRLEDTAEEGKERAQKMYKMGKERLS
ncbi:MAG: YtxH domain-containing protein [Sphingobacteriales bacterium]|nr:MAG: YtxH domain-containing protein [Sphingobacteriales bacterium]